jgi:hypothetical protein
MWQKKKESTMKRFQTVLALCLALLLAGCSLPGVGDLPIEIPGNPQLPNLDQLRDLGLPDLSGIANLPQIADLPALNVADNAIVFAGPTERKIRLGERIPGTDIVLNAISADGAEFQIGGMRAVRSLGDSLDFDGNWPGIGGVTYNLRLRVYLVEGDGVRAAGVHRLLVETITPQEQAAQNSLHRLCQCRPDAKGQQPGLCGQWGAGRGDERSARRGFPLPQSRRQSAMAGLFAVRHPD